MVSTARSGFDAALCHGGAPMSFGFLCSKAAVFAYAADKNVAGGPAMKLLRSSGSPRATSLR